MEPLKLNLKKGALHQSLGIPAKEKIPAKDLTVHEGDSALLAKRKRLARAMRSWKH